MRARRLRAATASRSRSPISARGCSATAGTTKKRRLPMSGCSTAAPMGRRASPCERLVCRSGGARSRDTHTPAGRVRSIPARSNSRFTPASPRKRRAARRGVRLLARACAIEPGNPGALRHLSAAALAIGQPEQAAALALRAHALAPADRANALDAAELLLRATGSTRRPRSSPPVSPTTRGRHRVIGCCRRRKCCAGARKMRSTRSIAPWP